MIRKLFPLVAIAALMGTTSGALAQKAGSYAGTSADGSTISLTVTENSGVFTITGVSVGFLAACKNPARTASEGWGFYLGQQVVNGDNNFHSGNDYYDISGVLHFPSNSKIKGTITSVTAVFVPGSNPPVKAQFCKSPTQAFALTFQAAPVSQPVTAVVLKKQDIH